MIEVEVKNPYTNLLGLVPMKFKTLSAILLCKFHFSIAKAKKNPPKNKKINGLEKPLADSSILATPKIGKKPKGKRAVIGIGIVSVIQKFAIRQAIKATFHPFGFKLSGLGKKTKNKMSRIENK
jgi:hypothetical protein